MQSVPLTRNRILAVDDNPAALYATARILTSAGYEVTTVKTGRAALEAGPCADLVVLDVNLPDLDGFEVCRQLRADPATSTIPVLHLSATFIQTADAMLGLAAGADGYLTRPVEPAVLVASVRTLLFAREADLLRRRLDAKLRMVFDLAPAPMAVLSGDFVYERVNRHYCALLGQPAEALVGQSFGQGSGFGGAAWVRRARADLERHEESQGSATLQRADGRKIPVEWRLARESTSGSHFLLAADVTARREQEAERERLLASERAARAEAERSNRIKDDFLATLSHEFRNPLNAILGWAAVLQKTPGVPASLNAAIEGIERNCRVQARMIEDLLDYAGITFGKMRVVADTIDPYPIIRDAVQVMRPTATASRIGVECVLGGEPVRVRADPARLQQIVWNLLSNAIKFSGSSNRVIVAAHPEGGVFRLIVQDFGKGIAPEFLPRVFERFSQEDAGTTRRHGGLGIGLAIVKQLTELQAGSVRATSEGEGCGATFVVELPLVANAAESTAPIVPAPAHQELLGTTALLVEDDADAREITRRVLVEAGATVIEAAGPHDALTRLEESGANILITDIGMPDLDGYELVRRIRQAGYDAARLPAVAVTAFARLQDRELALERGFGEHLVKPVDPRLLIETVGRLRAG